ncbi:(S)-acetoin forming diacetyl reductase [Micromonospora sonneratiae]|uniref:SDR family NAD(P)-dependent oxidoreductase n=1 Tax=Micromonospora sonneratiae TaxID=1184706 RepID=A0ABW3YJQ9_9ACTN
MTVDQGTGQRLRGRVAIVTGAGNGIGAAFAGALAAEGAAVAVADIDGDAAQGVASTIQERGGRSLAVQVDVTDRGSVRAMVSTVLAGFGDVDVLFNNAGVLLKEPYLSTTEQQWHKVMEVNGLGVLLCTQEVARHFITKGRGKVVNTCSTSSRSPSAHFAAYAASKASVLSLTHSSARALAPYGITVNGIGPGIIQTNLWSEMHRDESGSVVGDDPTVALDDYTSSILLRRVGTPGDVAPTAVFLASDDSDYITGQLIMVDGGIVLQ